MNIEQDAYLASSAKPPETAMAWSLFLTPIIGAIFWSKNWTVLEKRQHIWWTWVSAILIVVTSAFSLEWFGNQYVGYMLYIGWAIALYTVQRKMLPRSVKSTPARLLSGLLVAALLITASQYSAPNTGGSGIAGGASVTVGTTYDKNSEELKVSGTDYTVGATLYARVYSSKDFGTTSIKFMIEKKEGSGWKSYLDQDMAVSPDYQIFISHFIVPEKGTYKISYVNGNSKISDTTIVVH